MGTKLCMSCMNQVPSEAAACPHCGFNGSQRNPEICLPIGCRLNNRYVVGMRKEADGDCVSYVAYDFVNSAVVELREFLPFNGCYRTEDRALHPKQGAELHFKTSLTDFSELYRSLSRITNEQGLVKTLDFFEANGTAYAVIETFESVTLREFLSLKGGKISFEQSVRLLNPVLDALDAMHKANLIHRGVSPETIFVSRNGFIKLGGFATSSVRTRGTEVADKLYSGFTAPEQYSTNKFQSAATDVYAMAAVFYRCLSGSAPQDADQRVSYDTLENINTVCDDLPQYAARAIMMGLLLDETERTATILELRKMLNDEYVAAADIKAKPKEDVDYEIAEEEEEIKPERPKKSSTSKRSKKKSKKEKQRSAVRTVAVLSVILLLVAAIVFCVWKFVLSDINEKINSGEPVAEALTVPNFVGQTFTEASKNYDKLHFNILSEATYTADYEEGVIVKQSPEAGTVVADESQIVNITLYVNKGNFVQMISVVGMDYKSAQEQLAALGIKDVRLKKIESEEYAPGIVIAQNISKGTDINANTQTIELTVSNFEEETPTAN